MARKNNGQFCSFCGKPAEQSRRMVAGPDNIYICNQCVAVCQSILEDEELELEPIELEGTELLARAICHELDHLDGHMYVEKVQGELSEVSYDEDGEEA